LATERVLGPAGMTIEDIDLLRSTRHSRRCCCPGWRCGGRILTGSTWTAGRSRSSEHAKTGHVGRRIRCL